MTCIHEMDAPAPFALNGICKLSLLGLDGESTEPSIISHLWLKVPLELDQQSTIEHEGSVGGR